MIFSSTVSGAVAKRVNILHVRIDRHKVSRSIYKHVYCIPQRTLGFSLTLKISSASYVSASRVQAVHYIGPAETHESIYHTS